jgi:hypothetical protein
MFRESRAVAAIGRRAPVSVAAAQHRDLRRKQATPSPLVVDESRNPAGLHFHDAAQKYEPCRL